MRLTLSMVSGMMWSMLPSMIHLKPSWMPMTSEPERAARIAAAPITLLMPGAGPPPARIAELLDVGVQGHGSSSAESGGEVSHQRSHREADGQPRAAMTHSSAARSHRPASPPARDRPGPADGRTWLARSHSVPAHGERSSDHTSREVLRDPVHLPLSQVLQARLRFSGRTDKIIEAISAACATTGQRLSHHDGCRSWRWTPASPIMATSRLLRSGRAAVALAGTSCRSTAPIPNISRLPARSDSGRLRSDPMATVSFLWHLHQPSYRTADGLAHAPWVALHAGGSYTTLARAIIEAGGRGQVLNIVPTLLEQLEPTGIEPSTTRWSRRSSVPPPSSRSRTAPRSSSGGSTCPSASSSATPDCASWPRAAPADAPRAPDQLCMALATCATSRSCSCSRRPVSGPGATSVSPSSMSRAATSPPKTTSERSHGSSPSLASCSSCGDRWPRRPGSRSPPAPSPTRSCPCSSTPRWSRTAGRRSRPRRSRSSATRRTLAGSSTPGSSSCAAGASIRAAAGRLKGRSRQMRSGCTTRPGSDGWSPTRESSSGLWSAACARGWQPTPSSTGPGGLTAGPDPAVPRSLAVGHDRLRLRPLGRRDPGRSRLLGHLPGLARQLPEEAAIVIALDGENPWLHYPEAGGPFSASLMRRLSKAGPSSTPQPCGELVGAGRAGDPAQPPPRLMDQRRLRHLDRPSGEDPRRGRSSPRSAPPLAAPARTTAVAAARRGLRLVLVARRRQPDPARTAVRSHLPSPPRGRLPAGRSRAAGGPRPAAEDRHPAAPGAGLAAVADTGPRRSGHHLLRVVPRRLAARPNCRSRCADWPRGATRRRSTCWWRARPPCSSSSTVTA